MIQPWLKDVHDVLHGLDFQRIAIAGKMTEIHKSNELKSMQVGRFTYQTQPLNNATEWAILAREGRKVTQIFRGEKEYGVIVDVLVFKYGIKNGPVEQIGSLAECEGGSS